MIWYKVWYKIATVILSNHPVSGDLVPYSNKSHPSTHRNLTTSKKGVKGSVVVIVLLAYQNTSLFLPGYSTPPNQDDN